MMELSEKHFQDEFLDALKLTQCEMLEDGNIICTSRHEIYSLEGKLVDCDETVSIVTADLALSKQVSALWSYVHNDNNRVTGQKNKEEAYRLASAWSIIEENLLLNKNR